MATSSAFSQSTDMAGEARVYRLLAQAGQILLPAERSEFLDRECNGDTALKARIESILAVEIPDGPTGAGAPSTMPLRSPAQFVDIGMQIGPYTLLKVIGEGGMGRVYLAEQKVPVQRRVALKLINPGSNIGEAIARFESERQALALMDHPGIARVYEAGTAVNLPYFVMELIPGPPITTYCDTNRLPVRERLKLFVQLCAAIQHAHQNGIIHRDIKPSNVLVAGDPPMPKVIDFGIAKAFNRKLTDHTLTAAGEIFGTLMYMSPEQATKGTNNLDTRSDVYSLGVLLYELLCGSTPHGGNREQPAPDVIREIREDDPQTPSTRLLSNMTIAGEIAHKRATDSQSLARQLRGEMDWIVMRALEKDRARRYDSPAALAQDIRNYLEDKPVSACPASRTYLFSKWVRRNKILFGAGCAVAASLILGFTVSFIAYLSEHQALERAKYAESVAAGERKHAVESEKLAQEAASAARTDRDAALKAETLAKAERDAALKAERRANDEASNAKAVNDYLRFDLLSQVSPWAQARGNLGDPNQITFRSVLDRAAKRVGGRFNNHPVIEAQIRQTIGFAYSGLGENAIAIQQLEIAVQKLVQELGDFDERTISAKRDLAWEYHFAEKPNKALDLLLPALKFYEKEKGPGNKITIGLQSLAAMNFLHMNKIEEAREMCQKSIDALNGDIERDYDHAMGTLAEIFERTGERQKGIDLQKTILEWMEKKFGPDNSQSVVTRFRLAQMQIEAGQLADGEKNLATSIEQSKSVFGAGNVRTIDGQFWMTRLLLATKRGEEAKALGLATLETSSKSLGPAHPVTKAIQKFCERWTKQ